MNDQENFYVKFVTLLSPVKVAYLSTKNQNMKDQDMNVNIVCIVILENITNCMHMDTTTHKNRKFFVKLLTVFRKTQNQFSKIKFSRKNIII